MQPLTDEHIEHVVSTATEQGLPTGPVVYTEDTITMHVGTRANVETWAERLEEPMVEKAGTVTTGYSREGYTFRVIGPAAREA